MKKILPNNYKKGLALSLSKGFTLIELLVVIAIIATLAVLVFVALNPATRLEDARDSRRISDVNSILTAIHESIVDNGGTLPTNLEALPVGSQRGIGTGSACGLSATDCTITETACVDFSGGSLNLSTYLATIPIDPTGGTTYTAVETGYAVERDANGIVTVTACAREGDSAISASR